MTDFIEIHWTTGNMDEARRVCRYLVQERLVACAQILPWMESIYMWNNELNTEQETKVSLKTHRSYFEKIKDVILKNTSYEVPEILVFSIQEGNPEFLQWIQESVQLQDSKKTKMESV